MELRLIERIYLKIKRINNANRIVLSKIDLIKLRFYCKSIQSQYK